MKTFENPSVCHLLSIVNDLRAASGCVIPVIVHPKYSFTVT